MVQVAKLQEEVRRLQDEVAAGGRRGSREDREQERARERVRASMRRTYDDVTCLMMM